MAKEVSKEAPAAASVLSKLGDKLTSKKKQKQLFLGEKQVFSFTFFTYFTLQLIMGTVTSWQHCKI